MFPNFEIRVSIQDWILKVLLNQVWDISDKGDTCNSSQQFICLDAENFYNVENTNKVLCPLNENNKKGTCSFTLSNKSCQTFVSIQCAIPSNVIILNIIKNNSINDDSSNNINMVTHQNSESWSPALSLRRWAPRTRWCCSGQTWRRCATFGGRSGGQWLELVN